MGEAKRRKETGAMLVKDVVADIVRDVHLYETMCMKYAANNDNLRSTVLLATANEMVDAHKFYLPFNGNLLDEELFDAEFSNEEREVMHLPYDKCVFVFDVNAVDNTGDMHERDPLAMFCYDEGDSIIVMPFHKTIIRDSKAPPSIRAKRMWIAGKYHAIIQKTDPDGDPVLGYSVGYVCSEVADPNTDVTGLIDVEAAKEGLDWFMWPMAQVLKVMQCSNVAFERVSGMGDRRTLPNGRINENTYYRLTVDMAGVKSSGKSVSYEKTEARWHPRQHVRRGHIRRLPNGNRIWIQSCIVGASNTGVIGKEYKVLKAAQPPKNQP